MSDNAVDLRQFVWQVLETAKQNLANDGYLVPAAFLVTPQQILLMPIQLADEAEKRESYRQVVEAARQHNALAVVTLNDARYSDDAALRERYYPGRLADEQASECIIAVVCGPDFPAWGAEVRYKRTEAGIVFGEQRELNKIEAGLLEGWSYEPHKPC